MKVLKLGTLVGILPLTVQATLDCRPPGPVVPRPRNLTQQPLFSQAAGNLSNALTLAINGGINGGWPIENTSFSIGVVTFDQLEKAVPAWEYYYLSPNNANGTQNLTRDSQYIIGSVSKVISDYVMLKSGLDIDAPVVEYLPKLDNETSKIQWSNITLRQLGSHLAGIPPNYGFSEYYYLKDYFESLGFPHITDYDYANCGIISLNSGCSRDQFLDGMLNLYPVAPPQRRPVYSNVAFTLFVYAIQEKTGKNYTELLREIVIDPMRLSSTLDTPGDDTKAVIPPVENSWGSDYGDNAPAGGLISSISDLSIFFHGILDRSIFDTETQVLEWLKPSASTGSPHSLVGTPWEIYRVQNLTPAHPHTVDLYGKAGSAYGYQSQTAVIDEYGIAVLLLTAGSAKAAPFIYDAILATLVPAVDQIARDQANQYTGTFINSAAADHGVSFNITVAQDDDSMILQGVERNGSDILAAIREIWSVTVGAFLDLVPSTPRIYPVDIRNTGTWAYGNGSEKAVIREDWRIDWDVSFNGETDLPGSGLSRENCLSWTLTDWIYYGSEALDRVVFVLDSNTEEVLGLEIPFLRSGVLGKQGLL
ncbi:beta-lactamase/transpeptidase-like protein [Hypoxylon crocopeplum]|nr:beta-lactamase/transpeptidase-like protein [Hypoxylon crocopeplum]